MLVEDHIGLTGSSAFELCVTYRFGPKAVVLP